MTYPTFSRALTALVCLVGLWPGSCQKQLKGPYNPGEIPNQADLSDGLTAEAGRVTEVAEIPDLSEVELEAPGELLVRIIAPDPHSSFQWASGSVDGPGGIVVPIQGLVAGEPESVYLLSEASQDRIPVDVKGNEFVAAKVPLFPPVAQPVVYEGESQEEGFVAQTTMVWVVAEKGEERVYDAAAIAANPGFTFPDFLKVVPDVVYAGDNSEIAFSLDLNGVGAFDPENVLLIEADEWCKGKKEGTKAKLMVDDGNVSKSGDEMMQDRVYSVRGTWKVDEPGTLLFRAAVTVNIQGKYMVAYSPCVPVRVAKRVDPLDCRNAQTLLQEAKAEYDARLAAGWPRDDAKRWTVKWLRELPTVLEAGAGEKGDTVWARFSSGLLGALEPTEVVKAGKVTLFDAFGEEPSTTLLPRSRLVAAVLSRDENGVSQFEELTKSKLCRCPPWRLVAGSDGLAQLRKLSQAGMTVVAARGGYAFTALSDEARAALNSAVRGFDKPPPAWTGWEHNGAQQIFWTDEVVNCEALLTKYNTCAFDAKENCTSGELPCPERTQCLVTHGAEGGGAVGVLYDPVQADLATGRIILGPDTVAVTPSFIKRYSRLNLRAHTAFLGFPYSLDRLVMAAEYVAAGASAIVGSTGAVDAESAEATWTALVSKVLSERVSLAQLLPSVTEPGFGHEWRRLGGGNVDLSFSGLINPDFTSGTLEGWEYSGDARVLEEWCGTTPVGKHMAMVSTGIGYTVQTGRISQDFCLSSDKLVFEAWYDFISHEFKESCGSLYQDTFEMYLETEETGERVILAGVHPAGSTKVVPLKVDTFCPCDEGGRCECAECGSSACKCGQLYHPERNQTLLPWECPFDIDSDVFHTGWRSTGEVGLAALGQGGLNKTVKLVISVSDVNSKGGNSAVLISGIVFK